MHLPALSATINNNNLLALGEHLSHDQFPAVAGGWMLVDFDPSKILCFYHKRIIAHKHIFY